MSDLTLNFVNFSFRDISHYRQLDLYLHDVLILKNRRNMLIEANIEVEPARIPFKSATNDHLYSPKW